MKKCKTCGVEKEDEEFPLTYIKKRPGSRKTSCKPCNSRHYMLQRFERREKHKLKAIEFLGGKCSNPDCILKGIDLPPYAYDFHHIGEKRRKVSDLISIGRTWTSIKKELENCVLLCAICHRQEHA